MRLRRWVIAALILIASTGFAMPAAAAPGDNYVPDDAFTSSRTQWWNDDRFGMFIHFGLYSYFHGQYGSCQDAEWIKRNCDIPWSDYEAAAAQFNPTQFDANRIVQLAKQAGQRYIVITTKHHDGFAMWPTQVNDWSITARSPFKRDILRELTDAASAAGIKVGFYYSIWDWHNPNFTNDFPAYLDDAKAQLRELITNYNPSLLWFDGTWDGATNPDNPYSIQDGADMEAYLRDLSPNLIINNRVAKSREVDGDFGTPEQQMPSGPPTGQPQESCMTINDTWGYASWDTDFKSPTTLTRNLISLTSNSANYLLNIGPTDTGAVSTGQANALQGMGSWMSTNSTAIYGAGYTSLVAPPSWGAVTRKGNKLYLAAYQWPSSGGSLHLTAQAPFGVTGARVLGSGSSVTVRASGDGFDFVPTGSATSPIATVIEADITPPSPTAAGNGTGLHADFFTNTTLSGSPAASRTDPTVNYAWRSDGSPAPNIPTDNFSSRWTGSIEPRFSEQYTFTTVSDDGVRLWVDGQLLVDHWDPHSVAVDQGSITLAAGRRYDIRLEHNEQGGEAYMKLLWSSPNTPQQIVPTSQLRPTAGTTSSVNDDAASYSGSWGVSSSRGLGDYADDVHYTTSNGASFSYSFAGTGVDLFSETYSDEGQLDVYLDGVFQRTVNTSSGARFAQQAVFSARGLGSGNHTIKGVKRSGTYMLVDRLDVTT